MASRLKIELAMAHPKQELSVAPGSPLVSCQHNADGLCRAAEHTPQPPRHTPAPYCTPDVHGHAFGAISGWPHHGAERSRAWRA